MEGNLFIFKTKTSTQLLDTPPFCVDTERSATRHLIGQNMIVIDLATNQIVTVHLLRLRERQQYGGLSSSCVNRNFSKQPAWPWMLVISDLRRMKVNKIVYFEDMYMSAEAEYSLWISPRNHLSNWTVSVLRFLQNPRRASPRKKRKIITSSSCATDDQSWDRTHSGEMARN